MLIDKTKFMVLVAAISASTAGCVIVDNGGEGGGSEGGSGPGTTSSSSQGGGGTGGDATGGGGTGGDATGGGGEGGGGESCLGDAGTPDACSSECEAIDIPPDGISNCDGIQYLKGGVAAPTVACVNALNPDTCSAYLDGFEGCFLTNLALACDDPEVATPCSDIATACGSTDDAAWQAECSAVMSGLTEAGRTIVTSCMDTYCASGFTLKDCALSVYYDYVD